MSVPDRLGDFQIVEEIGRGGFGVVYRARQVSLDRPVALKVLYEHRVHTDDEVARFEREARAAARLDHQAIVSVYAWGEDGGSFFIAQKLVGRGRTLADEVADLKASGEPPKGYYRRVAACIAQVAEGLSHAHERGIVHRDVKPSNILLDEQGEPFLGDFGLAKVEDGLELSRTGDLAGSPFYMSPEQADSRRGAVDQRSDIYALGVTLYELLTLQAPFQGQSSHEIIRKILTEDPRSPARLVDRVPADLATICLKAMEKSPARRYASAAVMAHDLRCFLDGEPISAAPPSAVSRIWRKARRHRQAVGLAVMGVALVLVATFFLRQSAVQKNRLAQTEAERDMGRARDATLQGPGFQEQLSQALVEGKTDLARDLADKQKQWQDIVAQGTDLLLSVLPEIEDREAMSEIGGTLQEQLPLLEGAKAVRRYLEDRPQAEDQPDPRLAELTSWLNTTTSFLQDLPGSLGVEVPPVEGEGTVASAQDGTPVIAETPEHGAPPFGPPTAPDGTVGLQQTRIQPTTRPVDPDDGPSAPRDTPLREGAGFPPVQLLPASAPGGDGARLEAVRHLPSFLRFRALRDGLLLGGAGAVQGSEDPSRG